MVVLFPVPTWTAKFINGVQKKKMAAVSLLSGAFLFDFFY
jgi:hypothetical protein